MSPRKLEAIPVFQFHITEINSKHQSSFLLSSKVELTLLLAILNKFKNFRWYFSCLPFIEFTGMELLQHVNIKCNDKFYLYVKSFHLTGKSLYHISTQPFSSACKHHHKIINEKFVVTYTPCWKCHVHNKLTGLSRVGIGSLICIINLPIAPVGNTLMRLGSQGKGAEEGIFFKTWKLSSWKPYLFLVTRSYSDELVLRRIQYFITY